ncbi:MAG: hypothetical protein ACK5JT_24305 [Hyphomicrobiaceae bacterium]
MAPELAIFPHCSRIDVSSGYAAMSGVGDKLRLAIAVLERGDEISLTMRQLFVSGVQARQLGLIASGTSVVSLQSQPAAHPGVSAELLHLVTTLEHVADHRFEGRLYASRTLIGLWQAGIDVPMLWGENSIAPNLSSELSQWVAEGAFVLAVETVTPNQLWTVTRILLERSTCPVLSVEANISHARRHT